MTKLPLTKRQQEIYEFIATYEKEKGVCPLPDEIAAAKSIDIPNTHRFLSIFVQKGWLSLDERFRNGYSVRQ